MNRLPCMVEEICEVHLERFGFVIIEFKARYLPREGDSPASIDGMEMKYFRAETEKEILESELTPAEREEAERSVADTVFFKMGDE